MPPRSGKLVAMYREWASRVAGATAWTATSDGAPSRILPDGCMDIMWFDGHLVVAGPDTSGFLWAAADGMPTTGIRFPSGVAPSVLGVPAHAVRDTRIRLDELWPADEVRRLEDEVGAAPVPIRAVEELVLAHGRGPAAAEPLIADVVRRLAAGDRVATIGPAIGLSARQLQRRAQDAFGYGPKVLGRILRLGRALDLARAGEPLALVAAQCGFSDQPHLADDVRSLTGTTLTGLGIVAA